MNTIHEALGISDERKDALQTKYLPKMERFFYPDGDFGISDIIEMVAGDDDLTEIERCWLVFKTQDAISKTQQEATKNGV